MSELQDQKCLVIKKKINTDTDPVRGHNDFSNGLWFFSSQSGLLGREWSFSTDNSQHH